MGIAAVRYANPGLIPATLPRYAAVVYAAGVPGELALLPGAFYLPTETLPADQLAVGVVQYLPGDPIPADMRRCAITRLNATAYSAAVLADSPVGYWRLGEASGTSAADSSGNANAGTYTGTVTLGQSGALAMEPDGSSNAAALFDGSSGFVDLGLARLIGTDSSLSGNFSVELWVKANGAAAFAYLFNQANSAAVNAITGMNLNGAGVGYGFVIRNDAGTILSLSEGAAAPSRLTDNVWHHVVFTRAGTTWCIFVDGVQTATNTTFAPSGTYTCDQVSIGRRSSASGQYAAAILDEVVVYPAALSAARIAAHYNAGTGRP